MIQRTPRLKQAQGRSLSKFPRRLFSIRTSAMLGLSLLGCATLGMSGCQTNPTGLAINQSPHAPPLSNSPVAPAVDQYVKDINTANQYPESINPPAAAGDQPFAASSSGVAAMTTAAPAGEPAGGESLTLTSTAAAQRPPGPSLITLPRGEDLQSYLTGNHRRVVLDFYADWCGPCRKQAKILHELEPLAEETGTLIIKVDVDQHQALARDYAVASLPTLIVINDGEIADRQTGIASAGTLKSWMR
ncbi:thioredoxin family protein [Planctomycetaceae bacterium SH139]